MHLNEPTLYDGGWAPNARRVRIFLAEKGVTVPVIVIDLGKNEHKAPDMLQRNPLGQVPFAQFADGEVLTESVAICRYIEASVPEPPLFGRNAREQASVEMWNRRAELQLYLPISYAFRHLHPALAGYEVPQIPEWGEANKPRALAALALIDTQLAKHPFLAGDAFSIADITALIAVDFLKRARLAVPETCPHIQDWHARVSARPSAQA